MSSSYVSTKDFKIEKYTLKAPMSDMHFHHAYELYYVIKGTRDYFIDDQFFKATEGDMVLVPKDALHRTAGKGATRILVYFTEDFFNHYFSKEISEKLVLPIKPQIFRPNPSDRERLLSALNNLLKEYEQQHAEKKEKDRTLFALGLLSVLQVVAESQNTYQPPEMAAGRITKIVKYINENFAHINSVDEIAENFFISKYYFCKLFRKNMGVPLFTYLNTLKVQYASTLIKEGKHSMTDIASLCGFNNSSYFCKVFKSVMDISPSDYKKQFLPNKGEKR